LPILRVAVSPPGGWLVASGFDGSGDADLVGGLSGLKRKEKGR
jgi:hypothetical protein